MTKMNLPNKLTMVRMFLVPVFLLCFYLPLQPQNYLLALVAFVVASVTDLLDGIIARNKGLITDFGKLMDPLADKLIVTGALCCLLPPYGIIGTVSLVLILSREFLVTSVRLIAAGKGEVLAADYWGKFKTATQMLWICVKLFALACPNLPQAVLNICSGLIGALFFLMVFLTVASGVHYVVKNRNLFADA